LQAPSEWNVWTEFNLSATRDDRGRFSRDTDGWFFGLGIDRQITEDTVVGLQFELDRTELTGLDGLLERDTDGWSIGPYVSTRLSDTWAMSGLISYGQISSDVSLAGLDGSFEQDRWRANLSFHGQYTWESYFIRPSLQIDYVDYGSDTVDLRGSVFNQQITVPVAISSTSLWTVWPEVQISRLFTHEDTVYEPYAEFGALYTNEDGPPSASQANVDRDTLVGTVKLGLRARHSDSLFFELRLGYLSAFESDLDSYEASVGLAWSF
jgi:hypothetical protein